MGDSAWSRLKFHPNKKPNNCTPANRSRSLAKPISPVQRSDSRPRTPPDRPSDRLLIRRFRVQIPGGAPGQREIPGDPRQMSSG